MDPHWKGGEQYRGRAAARADLAGLSLEGKVTLPGRDKL